MACKGVENERWKKSMCTQSTDIPSDHRHPIKPNSTKRKRTLIPLYSKTIKTEYIYFSLTLKWQHILYMHTYFFFAPSTFLYLFNFLWLALSHVDNFESHNFRMICARCIHSIINFFSFGKKTITFLYVIKSFVATSIKRRRERKKMWQEKELVNAMQSKWHWLQNYKLLKNYTEKVINQMHREKKTTQNFNCFLTGNWSKGAFLFPFQPADCIHHQITLTKWN